MLVCGCVEFYFEMYGMVIGFKSEIDNQDWIIVKVEYIIDNSGFIMQFEFEVKILEWIVEIE